MVNGQINPWKIPIPNAELRLPLISTVCGVLIPPDQFLLIPMKALYNTLLEVTLSKYAFFTTGYCDVHEFDQVGMATMQQRKFLLSEI